MLSERDRMRFNLNKKMAQLGRVVNFLSFTLEERSFQMAYLRSTFTSRENHMVQETQQSIEKLRGGLDERRSEIEKGSKAFYEQKLDTFRMVVEHQRQAVKRDIQVKQGEIEDDITKWSIELKKLSESLAAQIAFLNDKTKCDISNVNIRVLQMRKDHAEALKKYEFDAKKKLKEVDDANYKKLKELEEMYRKQLNELEKESKPEPTVKIDATQELARLQGRVTNAKGKFKEAEKDVKHQKKVFEQNISGFRNRITVYVEAAVQAKRAGDEEFQNAKLEIEEAMKAFKTEMKKAENERRAQTMKCKNEMTALENEAKMARGAMESELSDRKRLTEKAIASSNADMVAYLEELAKDLESLREQQLAARTKHEELVAKLEGAFQAGEDVDDRNTDLEMSQLRARHADAIEDYKAETVRLVNRENHAFQAEQSKLEASLTENRAKNAEVAKYEEERKRLQVARESQAKSFESSVKLRDAQLATDLRDAKRPLDEESNLDIGQKNREGEKKVGTSNTMVSELESAQDSEFELREKALKEKYDNAIDSINAEFGDDAEAAQFEREFEREKALLEAERDNIVIPNALRIDPKMNEGLRARLDSLPREIEDEKGRLLNDWQQQLENEEERHRDQAATQFSTDGDLESEVSKLHTMRKTLIESLSAEVKQLTDELKELEASGPVMNLTCDPVDEDQQKLVAEIERLREEMKVKVKAAHELAQRTRQEYMDKIECAEKRIENELLKERDLQQEQDASHHSSYAKLREKRKALAEEMTGRVADAHEQGRIAVNRTGVDHGKSIEHAQELIRESESRVPDEIERMMNEVDDQKLLLDAEATSIEADLQADLASFKAKPYSPDSDLDKIMAGRREERDAAQRNFYNRPMRKEEETLLERLERLLAIKTKQLATVGKELLEYRHQLIHQEGQYNCRFGAEPSVAVMSMNVAKCQPKRPTTTLAPKRLPRLSTP